MHLTMINMFLNVVALVKCLGISIISLSHIRLWIEIARPQNDKAISEFYQVQVFYRGDMFEFFLKI